MSHASGSRRMVAAPAQQTVPVEQDDISLADAQCLIQKVFSETQQAPQEEELAAPYELEQQEHQFVDEATEDQAHEDVVSRPSTTASQRGYLTRLEKALREERERRDRLEQEVHEVHKINKEIA